jgi:glutamine amidotransferase
MIKIVDYGLGNIKAFANIYHKLSIPFAIAKTAKELADASKIILPGVGAFDAAMQLLNDSGMRETLDRKVLEEKIPVVGICVGMQILARSSDEGILPGLGWIDGVVKRFDPDTLSHKTHLPHMGWNDVKAKNSDGLFQELQDDCRFYFLHSYYFICHKSQDMAAETTYGVPFASAVHNGNIYGVQFHPEKSHHYGVQLLKNFAELN